jgi:hypothetical protein
LLGQDFLVEFKLLNKALYFFDANIAAHNEPEARVNPVEKWPTLKMRVAELGQYRDWDTGRIRMARAQISPSTQRRVIEATIRCR